MSPQLKEELVESHIAAGLIDARWVMEMVEKYHCGITTGDRDRKWQNLFEPPRGAPLTQAQRDVVARLAPCLGGQGSASDKGKLMGALYTHLSRKIHSPSGSAVRLDALGADTNFRCLVQNMATILGVPVV